MKDKTRGWPIRKKLEHRSMPEPMSGCQLWLASVNAKGYGTIGLGQTTFLAHRVAWEDRRGPIPKGLQVFHKCDVPSCINPDHLFLGTNADNVADKVTKGRAIGEGPFCEDHPNSKLTEWDVRRIRSSGMTHSALASIYGISQSNVTAIKNGQRWRHVKW